MLCHSYSISGLASHQKSMMITTMTQLCEELDSTMHLIAVVTLYVPYIHSSVKCTFRCLHFIIVSFVKMEAFYENETNNK